MILGIGTDLVTNTRVKKLYEKYGDRFLNKILSADEKSKFLTSKDLLKEPSLKLSIA